MRTPASCFIFILALTIFSSQAPSKDKIIKEKIKSGGRERIYHLFVPETLDLAAPAPLLITLHGSGRSGDSLVSSWKKAAKTIGIVLAGPDAIDNQKWEMPVDGPVFLRDLVESIKARLNIDPRRVYLFGHSAGATFALFTALFEPGYFAGVAVHAGALPNMQYANSLQGNRRVPIAIWAGDRDRFFPASNIKATKKFFEANGFEVQYKLIEGHDHNYYGMADKINKEAWSFLQSHVLADDPQWIEYEFVSR